MAGVGDCEGPPNAWRHGMGKCVPGERHPKLCEHRPPQSEIANGSVDWLQFVRSYMLMWITMAILELIHATNATII